MIRTKLHPISHLAVCLVLSSMVFACCSYLKLSIIFALSMLYVSFRIKGSAKRVLQILWRALPFVLSIAILQLLFRQGGTTLVQLGILKINSLGLDWSLIMLLRLSTVVLCARAIAENSFQDFQMAFAALRFPEEFSFMLSYGVQLIPEFSSQIKGFMQSLRLRGIEPSRLNWHKRIQIYRILAISSLAGIINNSTKAAIALELRGFRSEGKRSFLHEKKFSPADMLSITGLILLIALLLIF